MNILFCSEPMNIKNIDPDWHNEFIVAQQTGLQTHLLNYDALKYEGNVNEALKRIKAPLNKELCIYRGWMMPVESYAALYQALLERNLQLINTPEEYKHGYYLPESYSLIENFTPKTSVIPEFQYQDLDKLKLALEPFGNSSIIIKDYVKSQKHHWHEACFIPDASDIEYVIKVINRFIELQGDNFQGGLVIRQFIKLATAGRHPKSGMPLTREYRIFVLKGEPISMSKYWKESEYSNEEIPMNLILPIISKIKSNFYTIDVAKLESGDWVIIELGDAQVAEIMDEEILEHLYAKIKKFRRESYIK